LRTQISVFIKVMKKAKFRNPKHKKHTKSQENTGTYEHLDQLDQ